MNIVSGINTISEMNSHIASASEEQSTVAQDIEQSIVRISSLSENTVEGSTRVANATNELSSLEQEMRALISSFKIN